MDVTEPVTDVCPQRLCPEEDSEREATKQRWRDLTEDLSVVSLHLLLPDSLRGGLPAVDRSFGGFGRGGDTGGGDALSGRNLAAFAAVINRMPIFRDFERRLGQTKGPGKLVFFHMQMPHNPYVYLPDGQRYPETVEGLPGTKSVGEPPGGSWGDDPALARQGLQRYLLQIGDTDRLLGRLIDRMKQSGLYDRALIVVAADHGAAFIPGEPLRAVDPGNVASVASIPLLIKSPDQQRGEVDDSNVNITDVLPTIADRLKVKLPWSTEGKPAREASSGGSVSVSPHDDGDEVTLPFAEFVRRRDGLVTAMADEFGTRPAGLYRGGADDDLVGRRVDGLRAGRQEGASFELDSAGLLANVDPTAPIVPSLMTGALSGVPDGARLAVAVDGRVAASAVRWRDGDTDRLAAIVPPSAFARGPNEVDLIVVTGEGGSRGLALLPGASLDYRLVDRDGQEAVEYGSGRRLPVGGRPDGALDQVLVGAAEVRLRGHAPGADRVLAFAGPRLLAAGRPAAQTGDFGLSGWTTGPTPGSPEAPVRVFAVSDGRAAELRQRAGAP
jgi:Sulfatase